MLPSGWNNKQRSSMWGKNGTSCVCIQQPVLSIWHANSLHCALFRFQRSLFFLLIPQFVMSKAKQIDTGEKKSRTNTRLMSHRVWCLLEKRKNNALIYWKEKLHYDSFPIIPSTTTRCTVRLYRSVITNNSLPAVCKQICWDSLCSRKSISTKLN